MGKVTIFEKIYTAILGALGIALVSIGSYSMFFDIKFGFWVVVLGAMPIVGAHIFYGVCEVTGEK